jgi:poly-gamma-glutamate capsule biosynthesis protein CapA/YwtB (metallophosphatase superfamily)
MRIIIGADLVPTESNYKLFNNADVDALIGSDLNNVLSEADYRIFNLEVPLTNVETPIAKCGPNLIAPPSTIEGIKTIGVDFLTLANNHILDQGEQGLYSTIDILSKNGIAFAGVGSNLKEASNPHIFETEGKKIGIYCCAEHEFTIATETIAGANLFDPLESLDHIKDLKSQADNVIVLYHGGKEHYRYPSVYLQKVCRKCVEKGADLVVCQHTHCIGCEEKYLNGTIVYGQGNFLFDHSESEYWRTSLLIEITNDFDISYIPLVKENNAVRLADEKKSKEIMLQFKQRSSEILTCGFIEEKYSEFAKSMINNYLFKLSGKRRSFLFKVINKLSRNRYMNFYLKRRYTQSDLLAIQNYIECEAHREVLLKGIKCNRN